MWNWLKSILNGTAAGNGSAEGKYILVVDDSEVERRFYKKTLEKAGYDVLAASNATIAIQSLERRRPDLIISDLSMPEISGKEMCKRIKCNEKTENVPVIFLTGSSNPGDVVDCFDVGGEFFLEKPIDGRTLIRQVENILSDLEQDAPVSVDA